MQRTAELIRYASPIVPGHEIIGHVAAVGDDASGWKVGDRIGGAWHGGHDGESHGCRRFPTTRKSRRITDAD